MLTTPGPTLFFDFIDPGSYLASLMIDEAGAADIVHWRGFERRPPPLPLIDPGTSDWRRYHASVAEQAGALGAEMHAPDLLPWTRKAHELTEFARDRDCYHAVRRALFMAHFIDRTDIGRIDLLVAVAHAAGLDRSEAKAALDVDRYTATVLAHRDTARSVAVGNVPALVSGTGRVEGLTSPADASRWTRWITQKLTATTEG